MAARSRKEDKFVLGMRSTNQHKARTWKRHGLEVAVFHEQSGSVHINVSVSTHAYTPWKHDAHNKTTTGGPRWSYLQLAEKQREDKWGENRGETNDTSPSLITRISSDFKFYGVNKTITLLTIELYIIKVTSVVILINWFDQNYLYYSFLHVIYIIPYVNLQMVWIMRASSDTLVETFRRLLNPLPSGWCRTVIALATLFCLPIWLQFGHPCVLIS